MPKINNKEYKVLKDLNPIFKWLARDSTNHPSVLYAFKNKPTKRSNGLWMAEDVYDFDNIEDINGDLFQFIQWENKRPYNIQVLIDNYEASIKK